MADITMDRLTIRPRGSRLFVVTESLGHIEPGVTLDHHFHPEAPRYYSRAEVNYQSPQATLPAVDYYGVPIQPNGQIGNR